MQIDLPHDVAIRVQRHRAAGVGDSDSDVIRKALDAMDWIDQERQAIQAGLDAYHAGDHRCWSEFATEFMTEQSITPAE